MGLFDEFKDGEVKEDKTLAEKRNPLEKTLEEIFESYVPFSMHFSSRLDGQILTHAVQQLVLELPRNLTKKHFELYCEMGKERVQSMKTQDYATLTSAFIQNIYNAGENMFVIDRRHPFIYSQLIHGLCGTEDRKIELVIQSDHYEPFFRHSKHCAVLLQIEHFDPGWTRIWTKNGVEYTDWFHTDEVGLGNMHAESGEGCRYFHVDENKVAREIKYREFIYE